MRKTYRALVVEDEPIERDALAMMLQCGCEGIGEVQRADNGIAAIKLLDEFPADIVLMDINLPGINGLETIQQMRAINPALQFVITSAHDQFSYAQEALRLGVYDFLVKPITPEEISRVIGEVIDQIEQTNSRRVEIQLEKITAIRPVLESDVVYSIASMRKDAPIRTFLDLIQMKAKSGFVFVVSAEGRGQLVLESVKRQIAQAGPTCLGEIVNGLCIFVVLYKTGISAQQVERTVKHVTRALEEDQTAFNAGVGNIVSSVDDLPASYEQGVQALYSALLNRKPVVYFDEIDARAGQASVELNPVADRIIQAIKGGNSQKIQDELMRFMLAVYALNCSEDKRVQQVYALYSLVCAGLPEAVASLSPKHMEQPQNTQKTAELLMGVFIEMMESEHKRDARQNSLATNRAIDIVVRRYGEDLSLESISEELHFSMFYLSKLFKRETGMTFTEYLTRYRIEKAKEFLAGGTMSVKEIAYAVGFNSQGYFSKIFRKYTGITPTDYIKTGD